MVVLSTSVSELSPHTASRPMLRISWIKAGIYNYMFIRAIVNGCTLSVIAS